MGHYTNQVEDRSKITPWKCGDIVRIELDLRKGKITFIKKGIVMGSLDVDISKSPCVYYPVISVGDSYELIPWECFYTVY